MLVSFLTVRVCGLGFPTWIFPGNIHEHAVNHQSNKSPRILIGVVWWESYLSAQPLILLLQLWHVSAGERLRLVLTLGHDTFTIRRQWSVVVGPFTPSLLLSHTLTSVNWMEKKHITIKDLDKMLAKWIQLSINLNIVQRLHVSAPKQSTKIVNIQL